MEKGFSKDDYLGLLAFGISDIGCWRWWTSDLPSRFQLEFSRTYFWEPPAAPGKPPSGIFSLHFWKPSLIAFLTDPNAKNLPSDWPTTLHEDRIKPFQIGHDQFSLKSTDLLQKFIGSMNVQYMIGDVTNTAPSAGDIFLAFQAGGAGLVIIASDMWPINFSGVLKPEQVFDAYHRWWEYWREYWRLRGTADALPYDPTCEITQPMTGI